MEGHVSWIADLRVKDGRLEAFEELMAEMVAATKDEPGALAYEWYVSGDGAKVHIFEKYADSEAMVQHVNGFLANWAGRFLECVGVDAFTVYGDPSTAARELLDGFGAVYLGPWGGFSRI